MRRGEVTMHEFEDERPIPLGRTVAPTTPPAPAVEPAPRTVEVAGPPVVPTPPAAHIEKTRVQPDESAPTTAAPPEPPTAATVPTVAVPTAQAAPADHPMAALSGFRMEVTLVEPAVPVRDLARFVFAYVVVAAFVLGLIVAFIALTQVGSKGA
ncbi:MAG TPA: hypothetical protein VOB72_14960 [Candidatus Dormibacteraeota bacterium]|nr:hypothetical protein [Candidatus Dormibacteraeota bacterium]